MTRPVHGRRQPPHVSPVLVSIKSTAPGCADGARRVRLKLGPCGETPRAVGPLPEVHLPVFNFRLLPWEYGVRNLLRRPGRSALTLAGLALVTLLIFLVVGFIRGLEENLAVSGDPEVVLVHSLGTEGNVETSSVPARTTALLAA